jgi:cobalamin biosynthesis protein CobD/CbiB
VGLFSPVFGLLATGVVDRRPLLIAQYIEIHFLQKWIRNHEVPLAGQRFRDCQGYPEPYRLVGEPQIQYAVIVLFLPPFLLQYLIKGSLTVQQVLDVIVQAVLTSVFLNRQFLAADSKGK